MLASRHSWIWAVLAPDQRRLRCSGDPELAELLRTIGFEVVDGAAGGEQVDAAILSCDEPALDDSIGAAVDGLAPHALLAVPIGGGQATLPRPVSRPVRALQLMGSPVESARAALHGHRVAGAMRRAGLRVSWLPTGERDRKHGLGQRGWWSRRRLPVGTILVGSRGQRPPSIAQAALEEASEQLGCPLSARMTTVFESGKLGIDLRAADGRRLFLRIAGGPAERRLDRSVRRIEEVAALEPPPEVAERLLRPLAWGQVGHARYVLEPRAHGAPPLLMSARLWEDCLDFLVALHSLPRDGGRGDGRYPALRSSVERLCAHVDDAAGAFLRVLQSQLEERLAGIPRGVGHGDFWNENLVVGGGRLTAVLDWEWAELESLPLLDLMELIALSRRRTRGLPPGPRFLSVIWPLARAEADPRIKAYCQRTGTPADRATLDALAKAYWVTRAARATRSPSRVQSPRWMSQNVHEPLAALRSGG